MCAAKMLLALLVLVGGFLFASAGPSRDLGCSLTPLEPKVTDEVARLLDSGAKMIEYNLVFKDGYHKMLERKGGGNFQWNHWVRTSGSQARSLLMLDENYELLSLSTMTLGIEKLEVVLTDTPAGCIRKLYGNDTTHLIREMLLYDLSSINDSLPKPKFDPNEHVCNMFCRDNGGYASFLYHCCHYDEHGKLICMDVTRGTWMNILLIFTLVIKIGILLFSPLLIPERYYREKFVAAEYHYYVPNDQGKKTIKVVATRSPENYKSKNKAIKRDKVQGMDYFKQLLSSIGVDRIYEVKLDDLRLSVSSHRLIQENAVPVGVFRYVYNNICRCKIRFTDTLKPCCYTSICGKINPGFDVMPWHQCLESLMKLLQMLLLAVPWLFRVLVYELFESPELDLKRKMASNMGLKLSFTGSFVIHLTPVHELFLVCYIIIVIDFVAYGILTKMVRENFVMILRDCLRDMKEKSKLEVCGWGVELMIAPFKSFGILGFVLAVPFWIILSPLFIIVFIFYFIPTINISIRLIVYLISFMCPRKVAMRLRIMKAKSESLNTKLKLNKLGGSKKMRDKSEFTIKGLLLQLFAIIITIISFWSLTFLLMECISFFVEVGVYTLIGIIINAGVTVRYISVLFLLGFYVRDCFGDLYKKYLNFHKVIVGYILNKKKAELTSAARTDVHNQENVAFRIKSEESGNVDDISLVVKGQQIKWQTSGFVVFLDKYDTPLFSEKFFFEAIEMKYHGCPGPLYRSIYRTLFEFLKIVFFLLLFIIVIMAFGDAYNVSSTNQMLATVAGGLMPLIFRNVFAKKAEAPSFDADSVQFRAEFTAALRRFQQSWPVYDLVPASYQEYSPNLTETTTPLDDFSDAKDLSHNTENNNDGSGVMMTSSQILLDHENEVDLIIDVSSFSERYRAQMQTKEQNGSLSMLAESYRVPDDQEMITKSRDLYEV